MAGEESDICILGFFSFLFFFLIRRPIFEVCILIHKDDYYISIKLYSKCRVANWFLFFFSSLYIYIPSGSSTASFIFSVSPCFHIFVCIYFKISLLYFYFFLFLFISLVAHKEWNTKHPKFAPKFAHKRVVVTRRLHNMADNKMKTR